MQSLNTLLSLNVGCYKELVYIFYANLEKFVDNGKTRFRSFIRGIKIEFGEEELYETLGIPFTGREYTGPSSSGLSETERFDNIYVTGTQPVPQGWPKASRLKWESKQIHIFVNRCLLPLASFDGVSALWAWVIDCIRHNFQINWYKIITDFMWTNRISKRSTLPYGMMISYFVILKGVPITETDISTPPKYINSKLLAEMKIKK